MSELPLRTQIYTVILVVLTFAAFGFSWYRSDHIVDSNHILLAALLLAMIFVAEVLDISFPQSVTAFHVSVSAAFCFAAGLTVGPLLGGIVVALAHFIDGAYARRQLIKTVVNAANIGLSTTVSAMAYFALADPGKSPIGSLHNILAVLIAVVIYTLINTVSLALIVSPVMGMRPFEMWRANISGFHVELDFGGNAGQPHSSAGRGATIVGRLACRSSHARPPPGIQGHPTGPSGDADHHGGAGRRPGAA